MGVRRSTKKGPKEGPSATKAHDGVRGHSNLGKSESNPKKLTFEDEKITDGIRNTEDDWVNQFMRDAANEEKGSPNSQAAREEVMSLDSMSTTHSLENTGVFGMARKVRRRLRSPVAKRIVHEAFRKPFDVSPNKSVTWFSLYALMPLRRRSDMASFQQGLSEIRYSRSLDQGGRSLLWHAVRLGDELAIDHLLANGHGTLITKRDKVKNLDCIDLAILFDLVSIIEMIQKYMTSTAADRSCSPCQILRRQMSLARLDFLTVQPGRDAFWYDLYDMMPLDNDALAIQRFEELAGSIAESEALGTRDHNGASIAWHAARMEDTAALQILLSYEQVNNSLMTLDTQFNLDPLTIGILAGNAKLTNRLSMRIRDLVDKKKLSRPLED